MSYLGDRALASTLVFNFSTSVNGVPTSLLGSPVVSVYKDSVTETATGVTLTADYDRTGLNHVVIDTSADGTFYATGNDFSVVVTTGTVGGQSIAGMEVGAFSIGLSSAIAPTAATVAAAVWDLDATGHQTQGTFGQAIGDPASDTNTIFKAVVTDATGATVGVDVVALPGAIWDLDATAHQTQGTFGQVLGDSGATATSVWSLTNTNLDAKVSLVPAAVWDLDATGHQTQGTFGQAIGDPASDTGTIYKATVTDATGVTVGADTAAIITTLGAAGAGLTAVPFTNVWSVATRTLTANTNFNDPTAATIAAAVWDLDATGHQTQGTFGQAIGDPASDTNTIFKAVVTDATGATVGLDIVAVQADTDDIQARLPAALVGGRIDASVGAMAADTLTAAATAADFGTEVATAVWASATRVLTAGTNIQLPANGLANVTAWTVAITGNITGNLSGSVGSVTGLTASNLDVTVSSRLAAVDYTAPDNASIADILADTDELQTDWADGGRLDVILDDRASQASVDDLPTNAELATALTGADDAILAILGTPIVSDLATDIANVQSAVDAIAVPSPDDILDNEDGVETGMTVRQGLRVLVAEASGKGTGLNGPAATFYAPDGTTVRITGDVDPDAGTRDNVVLTP